ncbi:MAG: DNA (cytosine-5-)-methyltransferase [Kiritimatiellae bacterium]|nr:DNA (cytosine-5-)-methyltransferase [Kiritimatiellia bacterium]
MMKSRFTCIDLFAGIGGFRIAAEKCGGKCIGYSEINADAINTYEKNYPSSIDTNFGDITKLTTLPTHDFMTGGVPCQSWSIAGKNLGFEDDRGQLWNDAIYLLNKSRPSAFMFENVKGLCDPRNKSALNYIMQRIKDAGYYAQYYVINSYDYGVPQSRVRIYIIGFKNKCFFENFKLPKPKKEKIRLKDVIEDTVVSCGEDINVFAEVVKRGATSLSANNNGYNDYFLFNDLRNGPTTIHSWDIINTTEKQKRICLLLLKNRRKELYGKLDGNPLSLRHLQDLDSSISQADIDELCDLGIFKSEIYKYQLVRSPHELELNDDELCVLSFFDNGEMIPDNLKTNKEFRKRKLNLQILLSSLLNKGILKSIEERYDFRYTKISTGLFGVNRIFLPSSNIFPTLVASDSNDFVTPIQIKASSISSYRTSFFKNVYEAKNYRKITKVEACRIQGFPDDFILPPTRTRWMKLVGNSVSVPVVQTLVQAICDTGVFRNSVGVDLHKDTPNVNEYSSMTQMLLAIERKKAKMSAKEKVSGLKGKTYSKAAKPKKGGVAKNQKAKKIVKK